MLHIITLYIDHIIGIFCNEWWSVNLEIVVMLLCKQHDIIFLWHARYNGCRRRPKPCQGWPIQPLRIFHHERINRGTRLRMSSNVRP